MRARGTSFLLCFVGGIKPVVYNMLYLFGILLFYRKVDLTSVFS